MTSMITDEFDDEFADLTIPVHTANTNKLKRIGIEVDVTTIKGKIHYDNSHKKLLLIF